MRTASIMAFLVLASIISGCGPGVPTPVPVHGKVTLDGKPLAEGQIAFVTPGQVPEFIDIRDGSYDGKAKWGSRKVEIAAYRPYQIPADIPKSMHGLMEGGKENYLPDRYHSKTTLSAEILASGPNEFNFELSSK
ncbi:MAG: hypothetical protein K8U57_38020 [Planctomycetes bacterium]|nr:hypothetical protein [Planctomycetota bacterium]